MLRSASVAYGALQNADEREAFAKDALGEFFRQFEFAERDELLEQMIAVFAKAFSQPGDSRHQAACDGLRSRRRSTPVRGQASRPKLRPADQSRSAALTIASVATTGPPPASALATKRKPVPSGSEASARGLRRSPFNQAATEA
jgi:hypothetical protein